MPVCLESQRANRRQISVQPLKKSVVVRRQAHQRIGIRTGGRQALDGAVEFEELRAPRVIANQALNPEYAGEALPARDFIHAMARCRGVHDHVAGRQFCALAAEVALDDEFAAAVVLLERTGTGSPTGRCAVVFW